MDLIVNIVHMFCTRLRVGEAFIWYICEVTGPLLISASFPNDCAIDQFAAALHTKIKLRRLET